MNVALTLTYANMAHDIITLEAIHAHAIAVGLGNCVEMTLMNAPHQILMIVKMEGHVLIPQAAMPALV